MRLRNIDDSDCYHILEWRNSLRVRNNMYNHQEISKRDHELWWEKIKKSENDRYLICETGRQKMGLISINKINLEHLNAEWGFYTSDTAPRGTGFIMGVMALAEVFENLGIKKLSGAVLSFNDISKGFHEKLGFTLEGIFRKHYQRNGEFFDIYHYGILAAEWSEKKTLLWDEMERIQKRINNEK